MFVCSESHFEHFIPRVMRSVDDLVLYKQNGCVSGLGENDVTYLGPEIRTGENL